MNWNQHVRIPETETREEWETTPVTLLEKEAHSVLNRITNVGKSSLSFLCAQVVRVVIRIQYESTSMCLQNDSLLVGRCSLLPSEDKWWSKLSIYGTESMTDLTKLSSDIWLNYSEKIRTFQFFFGQWPKGRPCQKPWASIYFKYFFHILTTLIFNFQC